MNLPAGVIAREALSCEGVSVAFGGVVALEDVTFRVERGTIRGLIGPNGAGKTTLLNVLSGFQSPAKGKVFKGDLDVTASLPNERARLGLVRTFQAGRIFADLVVRDNILAGAIGVGMRKREAERFVEELIAATGFDQRWLPRYASELPFGEERRLSVVRALATKPTFLLLDEPAAGLNESEADDLIDLILTIPRLFGCGVVIVEHDMRVIMNVCDMIHVLDHGRTLAVGNANVVRNNADVITAYFGGTALGAENDGGE